MRRIPRDLLRPESIEFFEETRAERFGIPLDLLEKEQGGEGGAWERARLGLDSLEELVRSETFKVDAGPFVLGSRVSYADFVVVGVFGGV